jgi:hypothetical protein
MLPSRLHIMLLVNAVQDAKKRITISPPKVVIRSTSQQSYIKA